MPDTDTLTGTSYTTEDGFERYFATAIVDRQLYQKLEDYRAFHQISRSAAIRRILSEHLSQQLS